MTESRTDTAPEESSTSAKSPRDVAYWAKPVSKLKVSEMPVDAVNLNVEGRQVVGPLQGFGQMWQKTYRIRLAGAETQPTDVIATWKKDFPSFWPEGNRFYAPFTGIAPGEVAVLNLSGPGNVLLSTGVMVIYADEESFSFMTPQGHMFAGWITFSSFEEAGETIAQAQVLIRANDPLWEIVMRLFGFAKEDEFWHSTLKALAARYGVEGNVEQNTICVDPKVQWSQAMNVWHNAAIRSGMYMPIRLVRRLFRR